MQSLLLPAASAQQVSQQRLLDRPTFDQIVLNRANGGATLDVFTLELPQRPLTNLPATGSFTVRLMERPAEEFSVSWTDVARVRVFEELLLDEARRLTTAGDFDEAYDYFARLADEYPSLPGLDEAIGDYLRRNALALFQAKEYDRALALLLTLHERDPKHAGLAGAVETVASEVIQRYLRDGNFAAARSVLDLWQNRFRGLAPVAAAQWQRRFEAGAMRQVEQARQLMRETQYVAARKSIIKAISIWPQLEAAKSVQAQIQREFPFVTVGVQETAPPEPTWRIDSWASLRASRLTQRLLVEQVDFGSEGGVYRSPFGELTLDDSGRELTLAMNSDSAGAALPPGLAADAVARRLLAMATPGYPLFRPDFATLLSGVSIDGPAAVRLHFSRVSVRPEALLQIPPPSEIPVADFSVADFSPEQVVFAAGDRAHGGSFKLRAVVEQSLPDDDTAVAALLAGDVDVLDRVPPWQVERLRAAEGVQVATYRLPTVHVLIPNIDRVRVLRESPDPADTTTAASSDPRTALLLAKRDFRRALCYGIDRRWIVERVILGGAGTRQAALPRAGPAAGFDVLSGPFPAGLSLSDPLRYGYNNRVAPRPFEPRLAAVLATVAWAAVNMSSSDEKQQETSSEIPTLPELTLAHPAEPLARVACQSIEAQLERLGIPITLQELTAEELASGNFVCDLRYAELAVWEPLADARSILGPEGLAAANSSSALNTNLRQLDEATNWNDIRGRLAELHEVAHHELPVIPLWQTINYFAYRTNVRGIGHSPVTLYQNIEDWATTVPGEVAQAAQRQP